MVKLTLKSKSGSRPTVLLFGLSNSDIERLKGGDVVSIDLEAIKGPPGYEVALMWGPTDRDLVDKLTEDFPGMEIKVNVETSS
jgi:hypothetical protein